MQKYIIFLLTLLTFMTAHAQKREIDIADVYYDFYQFDEAIKNYELALEKGPLPNQAYVLRQMAKSYQYAFKYVKSEQYYTKLIQYNTDLIPEDYLDYGVMLKLNGKYEEARLQFRKYQELTKNEDAYGTLQTRSINWAIKNKDALKPVAVYLTDLDISGQSLGYSFYEEGMIYAHSGGKPSIGSMQVFDLDYAKMIDSTHFTKGEPILNQINFETNEGAPSLYKEGGLLYFNANASKLKNGRVKKVSGIQINEEGVSNFKIYVCEYVNGEFRNVQELGFNKNDYNCLHPCISEDGNTLYFASDMPGGLGGLDLYMVRRNGKGTWGEPINLGNGVNSEENEIFPFVHSNRLYFSTKGMNGYGGYDVYTARISMTGMPASPQNMGEPINSYRDELAFVAYDDGRLGYFSSNRDNDDGKDKVYFFHDYTFDPVPPSWYKPSPSKDSVVTASNYDSIQQVALHTKAKKSDGVNAKKLQVSMASEITNPAEMDEYLMRKTFRNVQFKLNDYRLSSDFHITLDSVVKAVKMSKTIKVHINAYTDATGSAGYNKQLSIKRALAVQRYLMSKGVPKAKIIARGFGETQLLNHCADGVACSAQEHAVNRRVEVKLVK